MVSVQGSSSNKPSNGIPPQQNSSYPPYRPTYLVQGNQVGKWVAGFRIARIMAITGVFITIIGIQSYSILLLSFGGSLSIVSIVMCTLAYKSSKNMQMTVIGHGQPYPNTTVAVRPLQYNYSPSTGVGDSSVPYQGVPNGYTSTYIPETQISSQYSYLPSPLVGDSSVPYQGNHYPPPPPGFQGNTGDFPPPYDAPTTLPPKK